VRWVKPVGSGSWYFYFIGFGSENFGSDGLIRKSVDRSMVLISNGINWSLLEWRESIYSVLLSQSAENRCKNDQLSYELQLLNWKRTSWFSRKMVGRSKHEYGHCIRWLDSRGSDSNRKNPATGYDNRIPASTFLLFAEVFPQEIMTFSQVPAGNPWNRGPESLSWVVKFDQFHI
jgi:hypothetical protein